MNKVASRDVRITSSVRVERRFSKRLITDKVISHNVIILAWRHSCKISFSVKSFRTTSLYSHDVISFNVISHNITLFYVLYKTIIWIKQCSFRKMQLFHSLPLLSDPSSFFPSSLTTVQPLKNVGKNVVFCF